MDLNDKLAFCIVDDIDTYKNDSIKQTIRNIVDFTISNLRTKGYTVNIGKNEDQLLQNLKGYKHAVVMSPGTEFINGFAFFEAIDKLVEQDFFVAGHILDRTMHNAYYELHHQCYVINMDAYNAFKRPTVGALEKDIVHTQLEPKRSVDNIHDDYTPITVAKGYKQVTYANRCHGWNLLKVAFEWNLPVIVFDDSIRNNKCHYYPESTEDFLKQKEHIDHKLKYCEEEFVHTDNTEWTTGITEKYEQVVLPASGTLYLDLIDKGRVVFYDYNKKALDYWKETCPRKDGIDYLFVYTNLLEEQNLINYLDVNLKTLVNLSNVFCYEGTAAKYSLEQRLTAQNKLLKVLDTVSDVKINFTMKADAGH